MRMSSIRLKTCQWSLITALIALSPLLLQCHGQELSGTPVPAAQPSPAQHEAPSTSPDLIEITAIAPALRKEATTPSPPSTNVPPPVLTVNPSQPTLGGAHKVGQTMGVTTGGIVLVTLLACGAIFVANKMQIAREGATGIGEVLGSGAGPVVAVIPNVAFGVLSDDVIIDISKLLKPPESLVILMPGESVPSHMAHPACKEEETPVLDPKPELEEETPKS